MWNGAFTFQKSIGTVTFVPIASMTARDWRWLDFDNIRTVAQNRIARVIMSGTLKGFFQIMITEKAAKNEYFWPASPQLVDEFAESEDPTFFINAPENLTESGALEALQSLRLGASLLPLEVIMGILIIVERISEEDDPDDLSEIQREVIEQMSDSDISLLLAAIMMWEMSLEESEAILDDLPESDEADVVRDWINDKVAMIEQIRKQSTSIAAGRGL